MIGLSDLVTRDGAGGESEAHGKIEFSLSRF